MNRARPRRIRVRSLEKGRAVRPRRVTRHRVHDGKIAIKQEPIDDDEVIIITKYMLSPVRFAKMIIDVLDLQGANTARRVDRLLSSLCRFELSKIIRDLCLPAN